MFDFSDLLGKTPLKAQNYYNFKKLGWAMALRPPWLHLC